MRQLAVHLAQAANDLLSPVGGQRSGFARRQSLEVPNDKENFTAVAAREGRHDEALIARPPHRRDKTFLL